MKPWHHHSLLKKSVAKRKWSTYNMRTRNPLQNKLQNSHSNCTLYGQSWPLWIMFLQPHPWSITPKLSWKAIPITV